MKKIIVVFAMLLGIESFGQKAVDVLIPTGVAALNFVAVQAEIKEVAKEVSQFRSKEFIMDYIIGSVNSKEVRFETQSLASDNEAGLITLAFNCDEVDQRGLLLAFVGYNRDTNGVIGQAYGFRYIPLVDAKVLLARITDVKNTHKGYLSDTPDVNNVLIEYEDIKFILYYDEGDKIRVFWNGFQVIWERAAFDRTTRRLDKWFK